MKCFVYCEWIDDERLRKSMPDAQFLDRVVLPGYRLVFATFVEDGDPTTRGGGCHLAVDESQSVPGLLYELTREEQQIAESLSRVPQGRYTPAKFQVIDSAGNSHEAVAYVIKHPLGVSSASDEYKAHMLAGARKHDFPQEYQQMLASL